MKFFNSSALLILTLLFLIIPTTLSSDPILPAITSTRILGHSLDTDSYFNLKSTKDSIILKNLNNLHFFTNDGLSLTRISLTAKLPNLGDFTFKPIECFKEQPICVIISEGAAALRINEGNVEVVQQIVSNYTVDSTYYSESDPHDFRSLAVVRKTNYCLIGHEFFMRWDYTDPEVVFASPFDHFFGDYEAYKIHCVLDSSVALYSKGFNHVYTMDLTTLIMTKKLNSFGTNTLLKDMTSISFYNE